MESPRRAIQSVNRAIDLLEALAAAGGEAALRDLSREVGLSKSTCHGLLATMEQRGYVGQNAQGNYTLGLRLINLGSLAVSRLSLRREAQEALRRLVDRFQETAHLVTLDGTDVVYIDKVESERSIRIVTQLGTRLPATCTGVGKAILAYLEPDDLDRLLGQTTLRPLSRNTITDKKALRQHLLEVNQRGFAIDDEEIEEGLRCVAAPIFDHNGTCVGALSLSGPSARMGPACINEMIPHVIQAARDVSRRMGSLATGRRRREQL